MYGIIIKRYCSTCKKDVEIHASIGYAVDDKTYFKDCVCGTCGEDVSKEDRKMIEKAKKDGKNISIVMH